MRGAAIMRDLRRISELPLRRETIYHLAFRNDAAEPPALNRLIASDPALALAALRATPRAVRDASPGVPQIARFISRSAIIDLIKSSRRAAPLPDTQQSLVERVWSHSLATAYAARHLSRSRHYHHPQTAFLAGLLHNLGLLALASVAPEILNEVLDDTKDAAECLRVERKRIGATHATIGYQLAKRWGLPQWLNATTRWHHQTSDAFACHGPERELVDLIREADGLVGATDLALSRNTLDVSSLVLPWKTGERLNACIVAGVRQTSGFLADHPLRDVATSSDRWVTHALEIVQENAAMHAEFDWQRRAWENLQSVPVDATPSDLTGLIAEAFRDALGALGVLCYVRDVDGVSADGAFCCEEVRQVSCSLAAGGPKSHVEQIVAQLRPTWQQRPYRVVDLESADESLAHVLLWIDDYVPPPTDQAIDAVKSLCQSWLAKAAYITDLQAQLEAFDESLQRRSEQLATELEQSKLAAMAEMAAGAGHELNNPLAVISGRAQLLLTEETDPRRRKSLETIVGQAQRIHRMIVDLMFFARPPAPECKPTAVADFVNRAVASLQREATEQHVAIQTELADGLPTVDGDLAQLAAALECILRNALEATAENGTVTVTAQGGSDATVQITVRDTGHGITDEQREHIFEPFYSGRDAGRGLGMGLPKAWSIVQNHRGEITVANGPDSCGTVVTVRLPAAAADAQRACA